MRVLFNLLVVEGFTILVGDFIIVEVTDRVLVVVIAYLLKELK